MTVQQFTLPDLGEGLTEGDILKWMVAVCDTVNCIDSSLGNASSPVPVRLKETWLTVGVLVVVVGVAVVLLVTACPEPLTFKSMWAELSLLIADELFCSSCNTVRLLPPDPLVAGLHALSSTSTLTVAINTIKNLFIAILKLLLNLSTHLIIK